MARHATDQPTVAELVRRAAGIVDPSDTLARVGDLERWFEDDDEPARTVPNLERRIGGAVDEIDPEGEEPALAVAAAIVLYLATGPRREPGDDTALLEQAVRFQFGDDPPEAVTDFLGM
jgi:hypothetical protein